MMKKKNLSLLLTGLLVGMSAIAFAAGPTDADKAEFNKSGLNNSGVAANRAMEYMERMRVARQIAEDKAKSASKVEQGTAADVDEQQAAVTFTLKAIELDESKVLEKTKLEALKGEYLEKEIGVKDLYELVNKINKLYLDDGYYTCRAVLPAQTIKGGVVKINLIEGTTNEIKVQGNKYTKSSYISKRMSLKQGRVDNINKLNEDLLRFNASNDVQLRISMQAGSEPGTTDYIISAYEPQNITWSIYSDNAGSDTSGEYRGGLFFNDRSLTGVRDALSMNTMLSDGTKSFGLAYSRPMGHSGTKLNMQYSTNSVHITDGPLKALNVRGHAYAASVGVSQPLVVTEKTRTEATLDYGQQNSKTDFSGIHWLDDTIKGVTAGYSLTNYGSTSIVYQKHSLNFGTHTNIENKDKDFSLYQANGFYQKMYEHGQLVSVRLDGQLGFNNYLPSARQFYIGGAYSVRGYKESLLGGDSGYSVGVEYAAPIRDDKTASLFGFIDHGAVYGDSAFGDHVLTSMGVGVRAAFAKKINASLTLGCPLIRDINSTEVSKTRLHFMVSGQF